jgi:type II secretory pathway component PulF
MHYESAEIQPRDLKISSALILEIVPSKESIRQLRLIRTKSESSARELVEIAPERESSGAPLPRLQALNRGRAVPTFVAAWSLLSRSRHRAELYRMWHAAESAGFTVPAAMETMGVRRSPDSEMVRRWLLDGTRAGQGVGDLAREDAGRLDDVERALLEVGAESGTLQRSLQLLGDYHSAKHRMMLRVTKRMVYPLFTGMCATIIAPIPLLIDGHAIAYLLVVMVGLLAWLAAGGALVQAAANHFGREPALVRARFARSLATAVEAGLPLPRAVRLAAAASADDDVKRYVRAISEHALAERSLADTLAHCPQMSPDFLALLATAERTGDFRSTMARLATLYEDGFR